MASEETNPTPDAPAPSAFVVGGGPVATALAGALRVAGVTVHGLWARRQEQAQLAAARAGVTGYAGPVPPVIGDAQVIIVAVRDSAIETVAAQLLDTSTIGEDQILVHCSGAMPAQLAFGSAAERVAGVGTLHPLRAIADGRAAIELLPETVFGVEGTEAGRTGARALAMAMGARCLELEADQMAAYHAAASMASNFLVAVLDSAAAVLAEAGIEGESALSALVPLAQGSLANVKDKGIVRGLTGPIKRGDLPTVARHLDALSHTAQATYRALGLVTLDIARRGNAATAADLDAIEELLRS